MTEPNEVLGRLMDEARMSLAGLARRVNDLGRLVGMNLSYDYTAPYRWIRLGQQPRRPGIPTLIAQALSERLGRPLTAADIGMVDNETAAGLGLVYDDDLAATVNTLGRLWKADLDEVPEVAGATVNGTAWTDATLSWLVHSGPGDLPPHLDPGRVGAVDVAAVRATVDAFAQLDNRFGGGHARRALIPYLRTDLARLLRGQYTEHIGRGLFSVAAEATLLAAWTSYDAGRHTVAQRYFVQTLRLAQAAENVLLAGSIMDAMSHQATFLGRHREAVNLARAARTGTKGRATATLTAHFHAMEARALSAGRDSAGAQKALGEAVRVFEQRRPSEDPEWIGYFDDAELSAEFSHCYGDLGRSADAIRYAEQSLVGAGASPRSDLFVTMVLASGQVASGNVEEACAVARRALDLGSQLKSARCAVYVRRFRESLAVHASTGAVRELEEYGRDSPLWTESG
jgi:tetratricopeptide (TPR) repeat protein